MYQFTDTTEVAQATSHSIKTVFNNINLDDSLTDVDGRFRTLSVTGRGILDRNIQIIEGTGHGARERGYNLEPRNIEVKFLLDDISVEGFRKRFERLNEFLIGGKKELEFTDEESFFYSTLAGYDNPEENTNSLVGVLEFFCSNPFKHSRQQNLTINSTLTSSIGGHESTTWETRTEFTSNQTGYEFTFNSPGNAELKDINKIVLNGTFRSGDILEIDYSKRRIALNGKDITNQLVILQSNWIELPIRNVEFEANHKTEVFYHERYY